MYDCFITRFYCDTTELIGDLIDDAKWSIDPSFDSTLPGSLREADNRVEYLINCGNRYTKFNQRRIIDFAKWFVTLSNVNASATYSQRRCVPYVFRMLSSSVQDPMLKRVLRIISDIEEVKNLAERVDAITFTDVGDLNKIQIAIPYDNSFQRYPALRDRLPSFVEKLETFYLSDAFEAGFKNLSGNYYKYTRTFSNALFIRHKLVAAGLELVDQKPVSEYWKRLRKINTEMLAYHNSQAAVVQRFFFRYTSFRHEFIRNMSDKLLQAGCDPVAVTSLARFLFRFYRENREQVFVQPPKEVKITCGKEIRKVPKVFLERCHFNGIDYEIRGSAKLREIAIVWRRGEPLSGGQKECYRTTEMCLNFRDGKISQSIDHTVVLYPKKQLKTKKVHIEFVDEATMQRRLHNKFPDYFVEAPKLSYWDPVRKTVCTVMGEYTGDIWGLRRSSHYYEMSLREINAMFLHIADGINFLQKVNRNVESDVKMRNVLYKIVDGKVVVRISDVDRVASEHRFVHSEEKENYRMYGKLCENEGLNLYTVDAISFVRGLLAPFLFGEDFYGSGENMDSIAKLVVYQAQKRIRRLIPSFDVGQYSSDTGLRVQLLQVIRHLRQKKLDHRYQSRIWQEKIDSLIDDVYGLYSYYKIIERSAKKDISQWQYYLANKVWLDVQIKDDNLVGEAFRKLNEQGYQMSDLIHDLHCAHTHPRAEDLLSTY